LMQLVIALRPYSLPAGAPPHEALSS